MNLSFFDWLIVLFLLVGMFYSVHISKELMKTPLDKTSGLSSGGKVAYVGTKALSQKEHLATILNKNKPKNAMFKKSKLSQQYSNPDYSYFKNNIKV